MTSATGSTRPKSQRHDVHCRTTPEMVGPSAGATEIARVTLPMTRPRSCSGTTVISVVISSGTITAVPAACTTRPLTSSQKTGASAEISVPVMKVAIATVKAVRVVTRCRNQPVTGMTVAMVSMNAVDSHWASRAVTSNSTISRGIALTMIVSLRMTMKVASTSHRRTAYGEGVVGVGARTAELLGRGAGRGRRQHGTDRWWPPLVAVGPEVLNTTDPWRIPPRTDRGAKPVSGQ